MDGCIFSRVSIFPRVVLPSVSPRGASDLANADPEELSQVYAVMNVPSLPALYRFLSALSERPSTA